MWRWKQRLRPLMLPGLVALVLLYTGDQLLTGERGIVTWRVMKTQIAQLQDENAGLKADIKQLETRTALLKGEKRGGRPDPDFLDEVARRELGYVKPGDEVILRGEFGEVSDK